MNFKFIAAAILQVLEAQPSIMLPVVEMHNVVKCVFNSNKLFCLLFCCWHYTVCLLVLNMLCYRY